MTNDGTFETIAVAATFNGGFTNNGVLISDPSTLTFTNLSIGAGGSIEASAGDVYQVSGNYTNESTQSATWNTSGATLELICPSGGCGSGADHTLDVTNDGRRFAWGELEIDPGNAVALTETGAPVGDFYAALVIGATIDNGFVTNIDAGAGVTLHYDASLAGNAYLGAGAYTLAGGGTLEPGQAVAEPRTWVMMAAGFLGLGVLARRAARRRATAAA